VLTSLRFNAPNGGSTCLLLLVLVFVSANLLSAKVEARTRRAVAQPYEVRIPNEADFDRMDRADAARARLPVDRRGANGSQKKVNQQGKGVDRKLDQEDRAIDQKVMRGICQAC
jgi:hypothetical protein